MAGRGWRIPPRHIALLALVLGLTIAGFLVARLLGERDARRDSEHQAAVAAAQIHGRVADAASLTASLGRYLASVGGTSVTNEEFASNAARWLGPAGFPGAGWVEEIGAADRAAYEQLTGHPIVTRDQRRRIVPVASRASYLPATLVSGIPPITVAGLDLGGESGMAGALLRARTLHQPSATPLATLRDGTKGLFLVNLAQRGGVVAPGFAVVFVSGESLRAAAADTPTAQLAAGGAATAGPAGAATVRKTFTEAGQRFDVVVPLASVSGAAAVLPWIILAAGFVLAGLAAALGVSAARRARAQEELDRIFTLSSDLIAIANFDGYFTRVNPAVERILGFTEEEFLARPYLDFVHPDDRERTVAEEAGIVQGKATLSFENRFVRKDGSHRVLEWTSTPAVEDRAMYAVARDMTDRHQAEAELARLAGEQAALRRVATLVARQAPQQEVFSAIAEEIGRLLGTDEIRMLRYEDDTAVVVSSWGEAGDAFPTGSRHPLGDDSAASRVLRSVAITPDGASAYVANSGSDNVSVIDTHSNQVVKVIPAGQFPAGVAITHDGASVYVANELSHNVTVFNTRSGAVEATLPAGTGPFNLATSPEDNTAYIADPGPGKIIVIDTGTRQTSSTITVGPYGTDPFNAAATRHALYVTNQGAGTLSVVDPHRLNVVTTVNTGNSPYAVAALPQYHQ